MLGVADVDSTDTSKRRVLWILTIKGPIEPISLLELQLERVLLGFPVGFDLIIDLVLKPVKLPLAVLLGLFTFSRCRVVYGVGFDHS